MVRSNKPNTIQIMDHSMRISPYQNTDVIDVKVKTSTQVHKEDTRYWHRPVCNCNNKAFAVKQYAVKGPHVVLVPVLLMGLSLTQL